MKNESKATVNTNNLDKKPFYQDWQFLTVATLFVLMLLFSIKFTTVFIAGSSMEPTFNNGEVRVGIKNPTLERFDCVVISTEEKYLIKRVIGMPGEHIEYRDNKLYVNGQQIVDNYGAGKTKDFEVTVDKNGYYCLGDNRQNSHDSRSYGSFDEKVIYAKVIGGE